MKRTAFAAAGATAVLGLGLFAAPAFAGNGPGNGNGPGDGTGLAATDSQPGQRGGGTGTCSLPPMGDLTEDQKADLAFWAEEEKMAHDLYVEFGELYDSGPFERIARSESKHLDAVRMLLERYGIDDPTEGTDPGEFTDTHIAALYEDLLAQGAASLEGAMEAGQAVENDDLEVLGAMAEEVTAPDVSNVLSKQITASERHLAAFGG